MVVIPFQLRIERGGKVVKSGERGGAGAIYSCKGCQSGGKRLYSSAELTFSPSPAYCGIRAGGACVKSGGVGLGILACRLCIGRFRVNIKPLVRPRGSRQVIGHGELGSGVVNAVFAGLWRPCGSGRGPGLYPPEVRLVNFP